MSPPGKKATKKDASSSYKAVLVAVVQAKTRINSSQPADIAWLIEELSRQGNRLHDLCKNTAPDDMADELDAEGVNLWNLASMIKPTSSASQDSRHIFALLRLVSFHLISAGMERPPGLQSLLRSIQLATKTASSLVASGDAKRSTPVLERAALMVEELSKHRAESEIDRKPVVAAMVSYYASRMEASFTDNNEPVAFFMLSQVADNKQLLRELQSSDIDLLACRVFDIGRSLLKNANVAPDAVAHGDESPEELAIKWIAQALRLIEDTPKEKQTPSLIKLRRDVLRSMARAYFLASSRDPSQLAKAEATISELTEDENSELKPEERQQLRWMTLTILKRRKGRQAEFEEVFKGLINNMHFNEANLTEILQEVGLQRESPNLIATINGTLLDRALHAPGNTGHPFVDRILVSSIFACTMATDNRVVLDHLGDMLMTIANNSSYSLDRLQTTACQSLLFQMGAKHFQAKQYLVAADWFSLGTHIAFKASAPANISKCFRKTALCYIQDGQYATASSVLSKCPGNEAATHYVLFLSFVYQGLEDEAVNSMNDMCRSPDFDRKMLLLATKLAHEKHMRGLILETLERLLDTLDPSQPGTSHSEAIVIIRCLVRVATDVTKDPAASLPDVFQRLLIYFGKAVSIVEDALARNASVAVAKDLSWLWRTAYNVAIHAASSWEEIRVADLFSSARTLIDLYRVIPLCEPTPELEYHGCMSFCSSICCRVFGIRRGHVVDDLVTFRQQLVGDMQTFRHELLSASISDELPVERIDQIFALILVLETEQRCLLNEWPEVLDVLRVATETERRVDMSTFEAIADILWHAPACPTHVLYAGLEAILTSAVNRNHVGPDKYSRWLRALCSILLSRGSISDRLKAQEYVKQAVTVMDNDSVENPYPEDEKQWLKVFCNNAGVEALQNTRLDEAEAWFGSATEVARFLPDHDEALKKMHASYRELLAQFAAQKDKVDYGMER